MLKDPKIDVAIASGMNISGIELFCPGGVLEWGNCRFHINPEPDTSFDYCIVLGKLKESTRLRVARKNTLFITTEPPSKHVYPKAFYNQFHRVISCNPNDPHPRVTCSYLGLCWFVGRSSRSKSFRIGYDALMSLPFPAKKPGISVICSDSTRTRGQEARLRFLEKLKTRFGNCIHHYGRGFTPIDDKLDAILPYRDTLSMENSCYRHYWTEKLTDAYLGWAHPIYYGCPNVYDYFPAESMTLIDIEREADAFARVEQRLAVGESIAERKICEQVRHRILHEYNPFNRFTHWVNQFYINENNTELLFFQPHTKLRYSNLLSSILRKTRNLA